MIDVCKIDEDVREDIEAVNEWSEEMYQKIFAKHFEGQRELYIRFKSTDHPITDSELEMILITMPLELFSVAECLSQFKVGQEVTKLRVKQIEKSKELTSEETTATKRKEDAAFQILENKLMITVQSAVIERVEREISFSRELIMGAKKIWDSRKGNSNPVGEVNVCDDSLPDYADTSAKKDDASKKVYIT